MSQRYLSLDEVIKENNLDKNTHLKIEEVRHHAKMAMVTNSLAYILADAAESFLMDCDNSLLKFDRQLKQNVKQNFRDMHKRVHAARQSAKKAASPIYKAGEDYTNDACIDSDWFYNFVKLLDDRIGVNQQKTNLLLEFLLNMPSEGEGLFDVKFEDFKNE